MLDLPLLRCVFLVFIRRGGIRLRCFWESEWGIEIGQFAEESLEAFSFRRPIHLAWLSMAFALTG